MLYEVITEHEHTDGSDEYAARFESISQPAACRHPHGNTDQIGGQ